MTNSIQWTVIPQNTTRPQINLILVGYRPSGMGGMNEVCAVSPLYDLRDMNLDGTASLTEKLWPSWPGAWPCQRPVTTSANSRARS